MINRRKKNPKSKLPKQGSTGRFLRTALILVTATTMACVGFWWWNPKHTDAQLSRKSSVVATSKFEKLKGKWRRVDGGYLIEIKSVDDSGRIDASYFNPRPIHVARAGASWDAPALKLTIELRDVNYPGSTYDLTYQPESDELKGNYYQAVIRQNFEVAFVRVK